ncbi:MAG: 50S ribosomal protein L30 [Armatimonadetes bacterium]|nr:50S ribosomal protein L30 [Armatimonadota bacterium]
MMARLKVTLLHSSAGRKQDQRETVRSLGLRKIRQTVVHDDNPTIRGMVSRVSHLVSVEEVTE